MHRPNLLSRTLLLLLAFLWPFTGLATVETNLFVSPDGSGSSFSQAQPGNLYAARDLVRTLSTSMTGDIVVNLYGGAYILTNSLQLQENTITHDSGTGGFNIVYQAYPGQVPVLTGGTNITGWTLFNAASNIWRAPVALGINSRQLYVNGVRAVRARGPLNPAGFALNGGTGFSTTNLAMQNWANVTNIEIVQRHNWKQLRCPVASISGTNIVMQTPGWTYSGTTPTPGRPWNGNGTVSLTGVSWVENAFPLLAGPGMWYLDQAAGYLYYIPRPGENLATATVVLPILEKLIDASGGSETTPIHNIVLSGITFEYGTWLLPSTGSGYADNQTSIMWSGPVNPLKTLGNVSFQTASFIQVTNCIFEHLGGSALDFGAGAHTNSIVGNHFEDISSDGISVGEVTDYATTDTNQMTDGNVIQDNFIRRPGQEYEDCIGIWIGYSRNTIIAHNDVDNTPYTGISLGWGWGTSSYAANNRVISNYVGKVMQTLTDGGSCYSLSAQSNSWHIGNYYKDSCYQCIYWDEGSAYWTAISNVFDNAIHNYININSSSTNTTGGVWNNHDNVATNNFSNITAASNPRSKSTNDVITNTVFVTGQNWPAAAQALILGAGLEPAYSSSLPLSASTINDADTNCTFHGSWTYSSGRTFGDFSGDVHSTANNADYVDCVFYGTAVGAVCEKNTDGGNLDVYLDGAYQNTVSCLAATRLPQQTVFSVANLSPQNHTLRLVKTGGANLVVDAFTVRGVPEILVNDSEPAFDHVPSDWTYSTARNTGDYHNDVHYTQINGQYVQYTFSGAGITWIGESDTVLGNVDVWLDGVFQTTVNCSNATQIAQQRLFSASNLSPGSHTIKLIKDTGSYMIVDAFAVVPVNYRLLETPNTLSITGTNSTFTIVRLDTFENFSSPVVLSVGNLPHGVSASFNPPSLTGPGFSTLTLTASNGAASGTYTLPINGVSGGNFTNFASLNFTLSVGSSQRWSSTSSTAWDNTTSNWFNLITNVTDTFAQGDYVLFDDTPGVSTFATIASGLTMQPAIATVVSDTNNFTISGAGAIGGSGGIVKNGASTLALNTTNSFTGSVTILNGILRPGNSNALGASTAVTFITNTGTLDVNGINFSPQSVTISGSGVGGNGAVINSGASQTSALKTVTLAGDTTFGGANRWDIRNGSLSTSPPGSAWNITKTGPNQVSLVGLGTIDSAIGNINVLQGEFAIQTSTTQVGDPSKTITVSGGATLELWALSGSPLNKKIVLQDGATVFNESGGSIISGPITLNGNDTFNCGGTSLTINSAVGGSGNLIKNGATNLVLAGSNTYNGATTINTGTLALTGTGSIANSSLITIAGGAILDATGRGDTTLSLGNGQTLQGNGMVMGNLLVPANATVTPGIGAIGVLNATGGATLQGTTAMKLNKTAATNDSLRGPITLTYGGTLSLTNQAGTLQAGDSFTLFSATSYAGSFAKILPAIPRSGLVWDTSALTNTGTLKVAAGATARPHIAIHSSASNVVLGGATSLWGVTYYVLSSTNIALPLSNWTVIATNAFDSNGNFSITNPVAAGSRKFFLIEVP